RLGRFDLAEITATRALVTSDEEGGFAVFPTFVDVGASCFHAHRVELTLTNDLLKILVVRAHSGRRLDPGRLAFDRGLCVLCFDSEESASVSLHCWHTSPRVLQVKGVVTEISPSVFPRSGTPQVLPQQRLQIVGHCPH